MIVLAVRYAQAARLQRLAGACRADLIAPAVGQLRDRGGDGVDAVRAAGDVPVLVTVIAPPLLLNGPATGPEMIWFIPPD